MVGRAIFHQGVRAAFYIFTDKGYLSKGASLRNYIRWHKLGTVTETPSRKNPNSSNRLTVWIWAYDERAFTEWWKTHRKPEDRSMCTECKKPHAVRGVEPEESECQCCRDCGNPMDDCSCDTCDRCERHYDDCDCCGECETTADNCECCGICGGYRPSCDCCIECETSIDNCTCCPECQALEGKCECAKDKEEPLSTTPTV